MKLHYPANVYKLRGMLENYHGISSTLFEVAKLAWDYLPFEVKNKILQLDSINSQLEKRFEEGDFKC